MATIDKYKIVVDVVGEENINSLSKGIDRLNVAAAAAGAGLAALFGDAIRMADAVSDLADATGLSAGYIRGLGLSIQQAGGDINDTESIITKFYRTLGELGEGSKTAAAALRKVGITAQDLKTLSERELLNQAIQSLAQMEAGAARTALGIELFGKKFAAIDPKKLKEIFATQDVDALTKALEEAGAMADILSANYANLQNAAVNVLAQLIGETDNLTISTENFEKMIKAVGVSLALYFGVQAINNILQIGSALFKFLKYLQGIAAVQTLLTAISGPKGLALVIAGGVAAAGAMTYLANSIDEYSSEADKAANATNKLNQQFTDTLTTTEKATLKAQTQITAYKRAIASQNDALRRGLITQEQYNKNVKALEPLRVAAEEVLKPTASGTKPTKTSGGGRSNFENQREALEQIKAQTEQMRQQLAIQNQFRRAQIELLDVEGSRGNLLRQNLDLEQQFALESLDYAQRIQEEYAKGAGANKDVIDYLRQQLLIKRDQLTAAKDLNAQEEERIRLQQRFATSVEAASNMLDLFKDRAIFEMYLNTLGKIGTEYDRSTQKLSLYEQATNNLFGILKNILSLGKEDLGARGIFSIQKAVNDFSKTLLKAYENVDFGNDAFNLQLIVIKNQLIPAINDLKTELKKYVKEGSEEQINALIEQMNIEAMRHAQRMDNLDAENKKQDEITNSFAAGLKQGLVQVAESITPFRIALDSVNSVISGIDTALTEFVKNGKFNFKDFAQSILSDMAIIIARALVMRTILAIVGFINPTAGAAFQAAMGFGGARAKGGSVLPGKAYLVGEKGPELAMFDRPGTIVPNNQLAMAGGGTTNVTYNINAVDASSFRSLVARDPQFIYNVTEVGRRSNPARRLA